MLLVSDAGNGAPIAQCYADLTLHSPSFSSLPTSSSITFTVSSTVQREWARDMSAVAEADFVTKATHCSSMWGC